MPKRATIQLSPFRKTSIAIINLIAFAVMIAANCLSIFLPLNGKTQAELSARYPNLFTPAGFTFSVWSVIYLLLLGFVIYQSVILFSKNNHRDEPRIVLISPLFAGVCASNAAWLFAWHYVFPALSVAIMVVHLVLLVLIHERLGSALAWRPLATKLWLDVPFSIYLGWICVAMIANTTAWFVGMGWHFAILRPQVWTIIMLMAATLIGIFYVFTRNNKLVALTIAWALYGIISKRSGEQDNASQTVALAAGVGIAFLLLMIVLNALRRRLPEYGTRMSA